MAALFADTMQTLTGFTRRRRRWLVGIASALVAYALLGFFLAPWLVRNVAIDAVSENLNAELRLEKVAINPFALSLRIDGLELDTTDGEPVVRIRQIFANFQSSSLFRWAWSFAEIHFDAPELFLSRDNSGTLNLAALPRAKDTAETPPDADGNSGMPRLFIHDFAVNDARVDWRDAVPPEPVETVFGPVSVRIAELNTLPDRAGEQEVVISTESRGTLRWAGSLQLNPLISVGHAEVGGSHFSLASRYIRHESGLDITDGDADIRFDYSVVTEPGGQLRAAVDNLEILLTGLRVSTFHGKNNDAIAPREFLSVPRIELSGGALRWPEQEVSATNFEIGGAALDLVRLEDGRLDFATSDSPAAPVDEETEEPTDPNASPWRLALDRFSISDLNVALNDRSVEPVADSSLNEVTLEVLSISNDPGASFPTTLSMTGQYGGTIKLDGSVIALPRPELDFELLVDGLSLAAAHPYIRPMADVSLDSGALSLAGHIRHDATEPLLFTSDVVVTDFLVTETDEGSRLGSWKELVADGLEFSASQKSFEISEVRLREPYGDILIAADGSVNLGRVSRTAADESGESAADDTAPPMSITIGRVIVKDAAADFADESLPLPFNAKIASLNGSISTISTSSTEPSTVNMEGKVDEFGLVRVTGSVTPLDASKNTNLAVVFENIEMPKFSAYAVPLAGRKIASGKLDLDLGYELKDRKLAGENKIVLRDFELGDEVDHPGAMSLPLGLAVALLKDPSGKIDIDLPVRGDLDDPEFGYGGMIGKALVNLVGKIVTSPFALLGNLIGVESDELEYVNFLPGRADLTPPEVERTQKLAEALALRPELILEISGVIDREADTQAIRTMRLDAAVESRIDPESTGGDATYSTQRARVIESMYRESFNPDTAALDELRATFTSTIVDEQSGKTREQFDQLAYTEALRQQLINADEVEESELVALARQRASNTREAVLAANPELAGRVLVVDLREEDTRASDDAVRMRVSLTTGSPERGGG